MQRTQWSTQHLQQCESKIGQVLLRDKLTLATYSKDFGQLVHTQPAATCIPESLAQLQSLFSYVTEHKLPLTLRSKGLSQSGQSLPIPGGVSVDITRLNQVVALEGQTIWIEASATWADLLAASLSQGLAPHVVPHNCHLSIGGVLSAGGVGASSFRFGAIIAHVKALEVITPQGDKLRVDAHSELFHACLGGQGRFAVISKACIKLRFCKPQVRTFFLTYLDSTSWLKAIEEAKKKAHYLEAYCTSAYQGTKVIAGKRVPFAQWLYLLHVSLEYNKRGPSFTDLGQLNPWKLAYIQDESISSYFRRHDSRFEAMKRTGQWQLAHPWYECYIPAKLFHQHLESLINKLPLHFAPLLQIAFLANKHQRGFLMLPNEEDVLSIMLLNPGVNPVLLPECLAVLKELDELFLPRGGKRYLSGFLGKQIDDVYWKRHFGTHYNAWINLKKQYDPLGVLCSVLYP